MSKISSAVSKTTTSTIVALATPIGNGGVGIIRISGPLSVAIAKKLTSEKSFTPRIASFTKISLNDVTDRIIAIYVRAPNSFTGEDVIELHIHGGTLLAQKVINAVISLGARLATQGEFTRRALLNGKMSLDQAEALINIIHAESDAELSHASSFSTGQFATEMQYIEACLIETCARIEVAIDHPEEATQDMIEINKQLVSLINRLSAFTSNLQTSNYIYNGIKVAILGKPNVGKSSLFNALLGHDRSIVTNIAGTTTDTVSESIQIGGFKVRFTDTAGIRSSKNEIEKLGIERTYQAAKDCDIAIVFNKEVLDHIDGKPYIMVDRNTDIEELKKQIIEKTVGAISKIQSRTIANTRQQEELQQAYYSLESALSAEMPDCAASDIQMALFHISNITGTNANQAVIDKIFSQFCLGK